MSDNNVAAGHDLRTVQGISDALDDQSYRDWSPEQETTAAATLKGGIERGDFDAEVITVNGEDAAMFGDRVASDVIDDIAALPGGEAALDTADRDIGGEAGLDADDGY